MKKSSRRTSTKQCGSKFGGRSTAVGVGYEEKVAAFISVKMLAGGGCEVWEGINGDDVVAVTMQDAEEVDDVVVELRGEGAGIVFVSAKYRGGAIALTADSKVFKDVINSFIRQFSKITEDSLSGCRLVWAVPSTAGRKVTQDLRSVLCALRDDDFTSLSGFLKRRLTKEREAMQALLKQAKRSWKQVFNQASTDAELRAFFQLIYVELFDFASGLQNDRAAQQTIRESLAEKPQESKHIWNWLELHFRHNNERGLRRTATTLRHHLAGEGLKLKAGLSFAQDIEFLRELTARNLERLKEHTRLRFPKEEIHVERAAELTALVAATKLRHLLVTGEPGCGKSGLMHPLAEALARDGVPVVLLLAEEIFGKEWNGLPNVPGLSRALDDVLANWPDGARGVLITDALDAVRDVETQKQLRRLLEKVQQGSSGWTVVASVREFDLKYGSELREMFPGVGVEAHAWGEFADVAHFHITGLADAHLDALIMKVPDIGPFIANARVSHRAVGIHRSPFFLKLAAELLRAGVSATRLADWSSPAVLLRRFWEKQFLSGVGASGRESALHTICKRMVELRTMVLSIQDVSLGVPERDAITELRSRGILQSPLLKHGSTVGGGEIRFSHHLLHDYAVARLLIPNTSVSFSAFAIRHPLLPIFYRQSFLLALEELWDVQDSRKGFWETAFKLEGIASLHGVSRNLAPILAGRRVVASGDLLPLSDAVEASKSEDSPAEKALRHMTSGLQDVPDECLCTGAEAWCDFAVILAKLLPEHASLETPLVHIIARLNLVSSTFADGPLRDLNIAARGLLTHHISKDVSHNWRCASLTAGETLCRTFHLAPRETETVLCSMLSPERLAEFPIWDLFDLARQLKYLGDKGDSVVLVLFKAAFSTEPKREEWENFGGRIMPLRIQSSDNWKSILYSLAKYYQSRPTTNAGLMTELACIAWNATARRHERTNSDKLILASFSFREVECALVEDFGHIWGRRHDHEENQILTHFETLLNEWAAAGNTARLSAALDRLAVCNSTSEMWSVFLTAGAKYPQALGWGLEPVLGESLFLTHPDYCYGGVLLFSALHKSGDMTQCERLERMILDLPHTARFLHDESREPMPSWLEYAQNKLLGSLEEANIVLPEVRTLRTERQSQQPLPVNREPQGVRVRSWTISDEDVLERRGVSVKDKVNSKLLELREALNLFRESDGKKLTENDFTEHWPLIGQCERAVRRYRKTHSQMVEELWGYLVGACQSIATHARWPADDARWKTVRRILLAASNDPFPKAGKNNDEKEDGWPSWGWPAPRIDAAQGLPFLAFRVGRADKQVAAALLRLCRDKVHALRFNLADRLAVLSQVEPQLMWELVDCLIQYEKRFSIFEALLLSLDKLWHVSALDVMIRLERITKRARFAPDTHDIHKRIAEAHMFRFLRTGDLTCESVIDELIKDCDSDRASHALSSLPGGCRSDKWLTIGDAVKVVALEEAIRQRTWTFFGKLLSALQTKLRQHQEHWRQLYVGEQPDTQVLKSIQDAISRTAQLVDNIAMQLYFASGASVDKQRKDDDRLTQPQKKRFWAESGVILSALADEIHPHTAHYVVQTLRHLLPCAPREVFLVAAQAVTSSSAAGYQHESLAVSEVVKLIQCALADHHEIFYTLDNSESECLAALLKVLDLFVEAGWAEARQLTHRLEEIYR